MADIKSTIEQAYSAFNKRDIDGVLVLMTEDVSWPRASESGMAIGKEEIRGYWTRQWQEFDPHVEPVEIAEDGDKVRVRVHQVVKSLHGELLFDGEVFHLYTMRDGMIAAMEIEEGADAEDGPTVAFAHQG